MSNIINHLARERVGGYFKINADATGVTFIVLMKTGLNLSLHMFAAECKNERGVGRKPFSLVFHV